ncbi:hypothetical protein OG394_33605 [Kribbella sp. NBC_01245]|uniref:hypothetical protein n=1 Tax=Kribbella sp. NBC_01245 TaxID=2903578 RepID=UPI002E284BDB|nr:hypothetical protein [Kribbella sp. NBC_01245]
MACRCGIEVRQPWTSRDDVWSPASFVGGLVLLAIGFAVTLAVREWFGWIVVGLLGLLVVIAWIVQATRGHRRGCLVRRGLWFGLAAPGVPIRVLAQLSV